MCWCAGGEDCVLAKHFTVDSGDLIVRGPDLGQTHECISSKVCSIDMSALFPPTLRFFV